MFAKLYRTNSNRHFVKCLDLTNEADVEIFNTLDISIPLKEVTDDIFQYIMPNVLTKNNRPIEFTVPLTVHDIGIYELDEQNIKANMVSVREFLSSISKDEHYYTIVDYLRMAVHELFSTFEHPGEYRLVFYIDNAFQTLKVCDLRCVNFQPASSNGTEN